MHYYLLKLPNSEIEETEIALPLLKSVMFKLQGATILVDGTNSTFVKAFRPLGVDLDRDLDLTANLAGEPLDDFFHNQTDIFVDPSGVDPCPTVIA